MKIDSPTFLSETTFISASVQFSSGSQKFGDTSDDTHQFTGSQSTTGTGSFAKLSLGTGTVSDTSSGQIGVELGSRSISGNNAFVIEQKDGDTRQPVFYARSGSNGGYETFLGSTDGYNFGYVRGWTGKLYMQGQHLASRNAGANTTLAFQGTGGISANKVGVSNHAITGSSAKFDFYTYGGGKFDIRSYYNETFQFRVNSGTAAAPEYATRMIFGSRASGGKIGLGGVTNPTEAVHIGAGSNLRNTGSFGDVRLYVDGNISGSATSTVSFGALRLNGSPVMSGDGDGFGINQSNPTADLHIGNSGVGESVEFLMQGGSDIHARFDGAGVFSFKRYNINFQINRLSTSYNGSLSFVNGGTLGSGATQEWRFHLPASDTALKLKDDDDVELIAFTQDNKISGSSSSTGSFGRLNIANTKAGSITTQGGINLNQADTNNVGINFLSSGASIFYGNPELTFSLAADRKFRYDITGTGTVALLNATGLGLGTSTPAAKLHVVGEVSMSHAARTVFNALDIKSSYSATRGSTIRGFRTGSDYEWQLGDYGALSGNTSRGLGLTSRTSIYLSPNASTVRMIIDGNSRVSLSNNDSGTNNTIFGNLAGANTSGDYNVYLGGEAGNGNTSGDSNVVIGYRAGTTTGTYSNSVFIGIQAGQLTTTGTNNTFGGWDTGRFNTVSSLSTYLGYGAGKYQKGGSNTFLGAQSGFGKSSSPYSNGIRNVAVGTYALVNSQASQSYCVAIGYTAGYYTTGSYNTFIGHQTGYGGTTSAPYSSGGYNTAVGSFALDAFTTGTQNVAIGYQAATDLTTGYYNTIVGYQAGQNITIGNANIILGWQAGNNLTTTDNSIMIGYRAGYVDRGTNDYDIIIGYEAGLKVTGGSNVGIGRDALRGTGGSEFAAVSTAAENTAVGYGAAALIIGSQTTAFGYQAGGAATGSRGVYVGYRGGRGATSAPYGSG